MIYLPSNLIENILIFKSINRFIEISYDMVCKVKVNQRSYSCLLSVIRVESSFNNIRKSCQGLSTPGLRAAIMMDLAELDLLFSQCTKAMLTGSSRLKTTMFHERLSILDVDIFYQLFKICVLPF